MIAYPELFSDITIEIKEISIFLQKLIFLCWSFFDFSTLGSLKLASRTRLLADMPSSQSSPLRGGRRTVTRYSPDELYSRLVAGVTITSVVLGVLIAINLGLGGFLVWLGTAKSGAKCEANLAFYDVLQGSFFLVLGLMLTAVLIGVIVLSCRDRVKQDLVKKQDIENAAASGEDDSASDSDSDEDVDTEERKGLGLVLGVLGVACILTLVAVASFGAIIYGTVETFGQNLWTRMNALPEGTADASAPCDPSLYRPTATFLLFIWVFLAVVVIGSLIAAITLGFCCGSAMCLVRMCGTAEEVKALNDSEKRKRAKRARRAASASAGKGAAAEESAAAAGDSGSDAHVPAASSTA